MKKNKSLTLQSVVLLLFINSLAQAQFNYIEADSIHALSYEQGNYALGFPYLEAARKNALKDFGDMDSVYVHYTNALAFYYSQTDDFKKAEKLFLESKVIIEKIFPPTHTYRADNLFYLAGLYRDLGQYEAAEPLYLAAIEIDRQTIGPEAVYYAYSLANLALLYTDMDNFEAAEPLYFEAIGILKKQLGETHPSYGTMLNNIGLMYSGKQNYEAAERYYLQAHEIYKNAGGPEHPSLITTLTSLGGCYAFIGELEKSEASYLEALGISKKVLGEKDLTYASLLTNLATLYVSMKRYKIAENYYKKTAQIYKDAFGASHGKYATVLATTAILYTNMKRFDDAERLFLASKEIYKQIFGTKHSDYLKNLNHLAAMYEEKGDLEKAKAVCFESIAANCPAAVNFNERNLIDVSQFDCAQKEQLSGTLVKLNNLFDKQYQQSGNRADLIKRYQVLQLAMQVNERERNAFRADNDKLRALFVMSDLVENAIGIAYDLALENEQDSFFSAAFTSAELNKSILLADALKGQRARSLGDLPDSLVLKELALQKQKSKFEKQELAAQHETDKNEAIRALNLLEEEINLFNNGLKDKYPKYHAFKYENITASAAKIQGLLDEKTALLEYFVGKKRSFVLKVTQNEVLVFPLAITQLALKEDVRLFRKALGDYQFIAREEKEAYQLYIRKAHSFYNLLLKDALNSNQADKKIENLIIIADGELGHLPFETFLTKSAEQEISSYNNLDYLNKDYNISYNYSATLFANALGKQTEAMSANYTGDFLACAANYSKVDSSLALFRSPSILNWRAQLRPLPDAEQEVKALSEMFKGDFLLGNAVNEAFFKENAHKYGVIHLAMHGLLHPRVPMLSSLAFTENKDSLEDNFLQAYEISKLHLNANLVVLSACETGFGKFEQGEGVISLARSFMYAGTPSLVVSLWQVNDNSTAKLMKSFYQNLKNGLRKDVALRQAKLDYIQQAQGLAAHPAFWSPFIQLGDNRPIVLPTKGGLRGWLVGAGFLMMLLGFVWLKRSK